MAAITSAAQAAIAAADPSSGESKENTLRNKTQTLIQNMNGETEAFWEAALLASSFYHNHLLTTTLTDDQVSDWKFWLPMDLFEWRWAKKIRELSPWWQFTHNTEGHYTISPAEYVDPQERWEQCEATLRQPTHHTMYNLPNDSESITYWDVFTQFTKNCTAEQMKRELDEFAVQEDVWRFITDRGCPKDMEDFVWRWAEEEKELKLKWQKWAQRGIEDHIITVTEEITGITMEDCMKKDIPPPLRRSATWVGKFYEGSDACPPRERVDQEGDDTLIMVEVRAPKSLLEWCKLEMAGTKENPMWKQEKLPAGMRWMLDTIWAHLNPEERAQIKHELEYWRYTSGLSVSIDKWLHIQLLHNFGDCFTEESKKRVQDENWMLCPRTVKF